MDTAWERANMTYSIMALHTRYHKRNMEMVMGPGTKYITMLRDPVDMFESAFVYYNLVKHWNMSLDTFVLLKDKDKPKRMNGIGQNQMLYDLGLDEKDLDNKKKVWEKIGQIERNFDLVMIAEYFSESMVMLRKHMCWDMKDVTSFQLNGRMVNRRHRLDEEKRKELARYLASDYILYNHFKKLFIQKMSEFGFAKLEREVGELGNLNKQIADRCNLEAKPNAYLKGDQKWFGPPYLVGFSFKNSKDSQDCALMTMSGLKYIERIRDRQRQKAEMLLSSA